MQGRVLAGRRILVTRAEHQAGELGDALKTLGATPLFLPGLVIGAPQSFEALDEALARLHEFDWIVFTSQNGVKAFVDRAGGRVEGIAARIAAVGPKTAHLLAEQGMRVDIVADEAVAESLAHALANEVRGKRVLLPRAEEARELLPEELLRAGALEVCCVPAYRAQPAESSAYEAIAGSLVRGEIDAVTFASPRTVAAVISGLREVLGERALDLLGQVRIFSIGPVTSNACKAIGLSRVAEANPHTLEGLVAIIERDLGAEASSR